MDRGPNYQGKIQARPPLAMHGSVLNAIWRDIYLPLITDDGTPTTAIKGDCRRDIAQRLGALLESNAIEMEAK